MSDTRIDHLGRWPVNYIRGHARGITLGTRGVQESQVSILWNCGLWAHHVVFFYRSSDIFHGHDSKACQRVPCQLCRQQRWHQGRGTKRTTFLLVERGGPIGKVLIHRRLPEVINSRNRVTPDRKVHRGVYLSRGLPLLG